MILSNDWKIQNKLVYPTELSFIRVRIVLHQPLTPPRSDLREDVCVPFGFIIHDPFQCLPAHHFDLGAIQIASSMVLQADATWQHYGLMVSELRGPDGSEKESWQLRCRWDCEAQIPTPLFLPRSLCLCRANLGSGFLGWFPLLLRRNVIDRTVPWFRLLALHRWLPQGVVWICLGSGMFSFLPYWQQSNGSFGCGEGYHYRTEECCPRGGTVPWVTRTSHWAVLFDWV